MLFYYTKNNKFLLSLWRNFVKEKYFIGTQGFILSITYMEISI